MSCINKIWRLIDLKNTYNKLQKDHYGMFLTENESINMDGMTLFINELSKREKNNINTS